MGFAIKARANVTKDGQIHLIRIRTYRERVGAHEEEDVHRTFLRSEIHATDSTSSDAPRKEPHRHAATRAARY